MSPEYHLYLMTRHPAKALFELATDERVRRTGYLTPMRQASALLTV